MEILQAEFHQPSWPYLSTIDSSSLDEEIGYHGPHMDIDMGNDIEFSSSFLSITDDSPQVSASIPYLSALSPMEQCLINFDSSVFISNHENLSSFDEFEGLFSSMGSENVPSTTEDTDVSSSAPKSLVLPNEDTELDSQLSIHHLLQACGEAMENQERELVEVILRRLDEKACPKGVAIERLLYYLMQSLHENLDYLTQEAIKNYDAAFRAFYQIFPYGRFSHFIANSMILESVPEDTETIVIVDFDMGEGVQWPPLIEALGKQLRQVLRLISIKCEEWSDFVPPLQNFEKSKSRLYDHTCFSGLKMKIEEMNMEELGSEMKKMRKNSRGREWLAFNCMVGLPHMGRQRNSGQVTEFLKVAQESINNGNIRGMITFGDGKIMEETMSGDCFGYQAFFEAQLSRATALLKSMEQQMPLHLREARIAMECLFVAPYVSSLACFEKFEERGRRGGLVLPKMGFNSWRMRKEVIEEAKELVREGDSLYWVRTEGESENQVALAFEGTPLVRVSSWC